MPWAYPVFIGLHAVLLVVLLALRLREAPPARPRATVVATAGAVALLAAVLRWSQPIAPQVYFDEFYYLATAHNIADSGMAVPLAPPYPQGWSCVLAAALKPFPSATHYAVGVALERVVGVLAALAVFCMLESESLAAATYAACAVAVLPVLVRMAGACMAEGASFLFVTLALWAALAQRRRPGRVGGWLAAAAVAWAVHFRPENILYAILFCGFVRWPLMLVLIVPDLCILISGASGTQAAHFQAVPRPGFATMGQNMWANIGNNLWFLVNGRILPFWVTPLALWGTACEKGLRGFLWGWVALFVLTLSRFPFGDFAAVHSYDTWRFSAQIALPLLLLGSRCLQPRMLAAAAIGLVLSTPWMYHEFLYRPHPLQGIWDEMGHVKGIVGDQEIAATDEAVALTLQEGQGLRAILVDSDLPAEVRLVLLAADVAPPTSWGLHVSAAPPPQTPHFILYQR